MMSATGLTPDPDPDAPPRRVSPDRLKAYDALMASGGIDAVTRAIAADQAPAERGRTK
jgi:hypothetical protein